jgi:hypothetical protein
MGFRLPAAISLLSGVLVVNSPIPSAAQEMNVSRLIKNLSAGDLSVLHGWLQPIDNQMMTIEGSANDALWTVLAKRGLLRQSSPPADFPAGLKIKIFSVTSEGRKRIPQLLKDAGR